MKIRNESLRHYLNWMEQGQRFAFAGYSDAEWYCVLGLREGEKTGLGQILSADHGRKLTDVLKRRQYDPWFLFAIPSCINTLPGFAEGQIDWFLGKNDISIAGYERDRVTDDLAQKANLYPLIRHLQIHCEVVMIGNQQLEPAFQMAKFEGSFVGIESPNLHLKAGGIEEAFSRACQAVKKPDKAVFLISAGLSAAVLADKLRETFPTSWQIDCGSMWDGFVKIGGQREWRAELYKNKEAWEQWKTYNLEGKPGRTL